MCVCVSVCLSGFLRFTMFYHVIFLFLFIESVILKLKWVLSSIVLNVIIIKVVNVRCFFFLFCI